MTLHSVEEQVRPAANADGEKTKVEAINAAESEAVPTALPVAVITDFLETMGLIFMRLRFCMLRGWGVRFQSET
ncbi:hypothetical protein DY251_20740 [Mesorhizobium denitrificans]|uniref:Uncharacterized protein n=1 Tax=Mesorhizobium denitrificans TaxID=2294114 RepID=A0A371X232_9HYPH|nr:hypothetical protein DY251_20740 [Mesorhizobium denitrificans]